MLDDGSAIIDARYTLSIAEAEGAAGLVSVTTSGVRTGERAALDALARAEPVDPDDYYFRFAAVAATSSHQLQWLTLSVLVASAARTVDEVRYDLYRME